MAEGRIVLCVAGSNSDQELYSKIARAVVGSELGGSFNIELVYFEGEESLSSKYVAGLQTDRSDRVYVSPLEKFEGRAIGFIFVSLQRDGTKAEKFAKLVGNRLSDKIGKVCVYCYSSTGSFVKPYMLKRKQDQHRDYVSIDQLISLVGSLQF